MFALKAHIRRAIEAEGIPYTIVCCNCFAGYFLPTLAQPEPPKEKVTILGDGNPIGTLPLPSLLEWARFIYQAEQMSN